MPLQTWRPDTCECVIEQRHAEGNGVQFERVIRKCAVHAAVPDNALNDVLSGPAGENRRKNLIHKTLVETSSLNLGELDASGAYVFRSGRGFTWEWTGTGADRVIRVTVTGATLTTQQRNTAQSWCDKRFGAGKVVIL